jgi:hypothetical protein
VSQTLEPDRNPGKRHCLASGDRFFDLRPARADHFYGDEALVGSRVVSSVALHDSELGAYRERVLGGSRRRVQRARQKARNFFVSRTGGP